MTLRPALWASLQTRSNHASCFAPSPPFHGLACETFAARWPQFRGPQASGLDASAPVPVRWNAEKGGFTSSPVSDGRNLFFASEPGRVYVVPANGTFSILRTNVLDEICMATPALSAGTLFYRLRSHLIAIGAKETTP